MAYSILASLYTTCGNGSFSLLMAIPVRAILVEQYMMQEPPGVFDYVYWASQ